jgi:hypothetical protein
MTAAGITATIHSAAVPRSTICHGRPRAAMRAL